MGRHKLVWNFNLKNDIIIVNKEILLNKINGEYSREYGIKEEIKRINGSKETELPIDNKFIIKY